MRAWGLEKLPVETRVKWKGVQQFSVFFWSLKVHHFRNHRNMILTVWFRTQHEKAEVFLPTKRRWFHWQHIRDIRGTYIHNSYKVTRTQIQKREYSSLTLTGEGRECVTKAANDLDRLRIRLGVQQLYSKARWWSLKHKSVVYSSLCYLRLFAVSMDGGVVRALAFHQCGPGSIPARVEFVVGSPPVPRVSPGSPVLLPPQKLTSPNFNSTRLPAGKKS